ncbi:MAG: hypothetical protein ABII64_02490 [Elusimicrobiota bacterium]
MYRKLVCMVICMLLITAPNAHCYVRGVILLIASGVLLSEGKNVSSRTSEYNRQANLALASAEDEQESAKEDMDKAYEWLLELSDRGMGTGLSEEKILWGYYNRSLTAAYEHNNNSIAYNYQAGVYRGQADNYESYAKSINNLASVTAIIGLIDIAIDAYRDLKKDKARQNSTKNSIKMNYYVNGNSINFVVSKSF